MELGTYLTWTQMWGKYFTPKQSMQLNVSLNKKPVCEKKTTSFLLLSAISLDRPHYIHVFSNLALVEQNQTGQATLITDPPPGPPNFFVTCDS